MAQINWTQATRLGIAAKLAGEMRRSIRRNERAEMYELAGLIEMVADADITFLRLHEERFAVLLESEEELSESQAVSKANSQAQI